jgi:hypothetical protein
MKQTAVEWLEKIHQGQKEQPFDDYEWEIAFNYAKEMEKEQQGYSEEEVRDAINLVKKYDEWSIEHGESFFAYIEDQIIQQLKGKQQEQ